MLWNLIIAPQISCHLSTKHHFSFRLWVTNEGWAVFLSSFAAHALLQILQGLVHKMIPVSKWILWAIYQPHKNSEDVCFCSESANYFWSLETLCRHVQAETVEKNKTAKKGEEEQQRNGKRKLQSRQLLSSSQHPLFHINTEMSIFQITKLEG